jgi:hypothetical protein
MKGAFDERPIDHYPAFTESGSMSSSRITKPQQQPLPKDVADLANLIAALPEEHRRTLEPVCQRVLDSTRRRQRILALVQEALSQLRLDMKYLLFDLEATRRERNRYKETLENGSSEGGNAEGGF